MKTLKIFALIIIVLTNLPTFAQTSALGTIYAEIVPQIAVNQIQQMSFGQFTPLGNGGTVIVTPQGKRTTNGTIVVTDNPVHQGIFSVSGTQDNKLNVILPNSPIYIYHQNGVNFMSVNNWTLEMPNGGNSETGKDFVVNIGASITIGSLETNPIGFYMGTYPVVFFYN